MARGTSVQAFLVIGSTITYHSLRRKVTFLILYPPVYVCVQTWSCAIVINLRKHYHPFYTSFVERDGKFPYTCIRSSNS